MANFWSMQFLVNLGIFAKIFFLATNFKVLALNDSKGKEQCVGKYHVGVDNITDIWSSNMLIKFNGLDKIPNNSTIENNGHILKIELNYHGTVPTMQVNSSPFGVDGTFRLQFLYFHWLKQAPSSLHFNGIKLPAQLHAVFCHVKAKSCDPAVALDNTIIALAFHMGVSNLESVNIADLKSKLQHVRQPNSKTQIGNFNLNYWTKSIQNEQVSYEGSFSEFPCQAKVIWVDYSVALTLKAQTVYEFQKLKANDGNSLMAEVSEFAKPKGKVYFKNPAKENNLPIPGLIIGLFGILPILN